MIGSKSLAWLEHSHLADGEGLKPQIVLWIGGKTVVGGLLGGYLGADLKKRALGIRQRTGDPLVTGLIVGIAIGRIGCFLSGLTDETYGLPSDLAWAVDFGDGPRHPTQLYEMAWLGLTYLGLQPLQQQATKYPGLRSQCFLGSYLAFRLLIDGLKPRGTVFMGFSPIQWAATAGLLVVLSQLSTILARRKEPAHA